MIKNIYRKIVSEKQRIALHYALYKIEAVLLWGNRYECCCCGKSSRRFLSHGNLGLRKNIKCPHCLSLERTRIFACTSKNEIFQNAGNNTKCSVTPFAPVKGLKSFLKKFAIRLDLYRCRSQSERCYLPGRYDPNAL